MSKKYLVYNDRLVEKVLDDNVKYYCINCVFAKHEEAYCHEITGGCIASSTQVYYKYSDKEIINF